MIESLLQSRITFLRAQKLPHVHGQCVGQNATQPRRKLFGRCATKVRDISVSGHEHFLSNIRRIGFPLHVLMQLRPSQKNNILAMTRQQLAQRLAIPLPRSIDQPLRTTGRLRAFGMGLVIQWKWSG